MLAINEDRVLSDLRALAEFLPSIDGRSHDVSENTSEADIRRGFRVFAAAVSKTLERLARGGGSRAPLSRREKEPAS
jgi:hypothetical protein